MRFSAIAVLTGLTGCALFCAVSPPAQSQVRTDTARCLAIADIDERVECLEGRTATTPAATLTPSVIPNRNPREPGTLQPAATGPVSTVQPGKSEPASRAPFKTDGVLVQSSAATKQPIQPPQPNLDHDQSFMPLVAIGIVLSLVCWLSLRAFRKVQRRRRLIEQYGDVIALKILAHEVWQGMTVEQLVESWGNPADTDREIIKAKTKETWKYIQTGKNRFKNRIYLENGIVIGWKI